MKIQLIEINQPIGTLYMGKIKMNELRQIAVIKRRGQKIDGIQRDLKEKRIKDIQYYCKDPDATFPTPIILSVETNNILNKIADQIFEIDLEQECAEIIDGQHRFEGIKAAGMDDLVLPVILMFNLDNSQKAYIFSTINNNQTKVDKSLIYDLFDVAKERSPFKTCHEIAKVLNGESNSAFCGKIKMLEKRQSDEETLSQGTFVTQLLKLITTKPNKDWIDNKNSEKIEDNSNLVFRKYYNQSQDEVITKILMNYFNAARKVFNKEWNDADNYILTKTTGYTAMIKALKTIVPVGEEKADLSESFFNEIFESLKVLLNAQSKKLTSEFYPSGAAGESNLAKDITDCIK